MMQNAKFSCVIGLLGLLLIHVEGRSLQRRSNHLNDATVQPGCALLQVMQGEPGPPGEQGDTGPQGPQGPPGLTGSTGPKCGGTVYTRWGRTTCPSVAGTELVYDGYAAGSMWSATGGTTSYLCLPKQPTYSSYYSGVQGGSPVNIVEMESTYNTGGTSGPLRNVYNQNMPCAVCYVSTRVAQMTFPATTSCPNSWTKEYSGYLMTAATRAPHYRTETVCVDGNAEPLPGGTGDEPHAAVFYFMEAACNGIPCPPYDPQKELTCAVCTR